MRDDELAPFAEQAGEAGLTGFALEAVILRHLHPGQRSSGGRQRVAFAGQCLFPIEKRLAGIEPCFARDNWMIHGAFPVFNGAK